VERVVSWLAVALAEAAQRVGPAAAGRPARLISEPSAIVNIVFRHGESSIGEADPPAVDTNAATTLH